MNGAPDPELTNLLEAQRSAERTRQAFHSRDALRHRGVAWSGLSPEPFEPRSEPALLAAAQVGLGARKAWRAAPAGRFLAAIAQAQQAAQAAHAVGEAARARVSRSFDAERLDCAAAAEELERHAHVLLASARRAHDAALTAAR